MIKTLACSLASFSLLALVSAGCTTTSFSGDAHVKGGAPACEAKCKGWGLEFVGMVAMGEYSDGCICKRPGTPTAAALDMTGGAATATAAVVTQMRREEEQRQAQSNTLHP